MKVGTVEWKNRYRILDIQAGVPAGLEQHPEVERFCTAELRDFDSAINQYRSHPKLEAAVETLRCSVADPFLSFLNLEATSIPFLEQVVSRDEARLATAPEFMRASNEFLELFEKEKEIAQKLKTLTMEARERLPEYKQFVLHAMQAVISRGQSRRIAIVGSYNPWDKAEERNKVYRAAASSQWCIGWEAVFRLHDTALMLQKNENAMCVYESAKALGKELSAGMIHPVFGDFDASPEAVDRCLAKFPASSEVQELEKVLTAYYGKRRKEIFD